MRILPLSQRMRAFQPSSILVNKELKIMTLFWWHEWVQFYNDQKCLHYSLRCPSFNSLQGRCDPTGEEEWTDHSVMAITNLFTSNCGYLPSGALLRMRRFLELVTMGRAEWWRNRAGAPDSTADELSYSMSDIFEPQKRQKFNPQKQTPIITGIMNNYWNDARKHV